MIRIVIKSVLIALIINLTTPRPAYAYIDPSTGGMLFQVLAAAFAVFSGFVLIFSRQIRMAFARARRWLRALLGRDHRQVSDTQTHSQRTDVQEEQDS